MTRRIDPGEKSTSRNILFRENKHSRLEAHTPKVSPSITSMKTKRAIYQANSISERPAVPDLVIAACKKWRNVRLTPREMLRLQGFDSFEIVCKHANTNKPAIPAPVELSSKSGLMKVSHR